MTVSFANTLSRVHTHTQTHSHSECTMMTMLSTRMGSLSPPSRQCAEFKLNLSQQHAINSVKKVSFPIENVDFGSARSNGTGRQGCSRRNGTSRDYFYSGSGVGVIWSRPEYYGVIRNFPESESSGVGRRHNGHKMAVLRCLWAGCSLNGAFFLIRFVFFIFLSNPDKSF